MSLKKTLLLVIAGALFIYSPILLQSSLNSKTESLFSNPPSWDWDRDCTVLKSDETYKDSDCVYRTPNSDGLIFLFGDSHAGAASYPVLELAKSLNMDLQISAMQSCRFFYLNQLKTESDYLSSECNDHNLRIRDYLERRKPDLVIFITRGAEADESKTTFRDIQSNNLAQLPIDPEKLLIIGPVASWDLPKSAFEIVMKKEAKVISDPLGDDEFWRVAARSQGNQYVSSYKILCPQDNCLRSIGKIKIYEDTDHLSVTGYRMVLSGLKEFFL